MTTQTGNNTPDSDDQPVAEPLREAGMRRVTRRDVLRRGIALGLSAPAIGWLLAACGGNNNGGNAPISTTTGGGAGPSPTVATGGGAATTPTSGSMVSGSPVSKSPVSGSPSSGTAQNGGRLTLIITGNVPDLDPQSAYDSTASSVFFGTHEMLVRLKGSNTFEYEPMLAEKWEASADNTTWTFTIPSGVTFHDGSPCDGEAVAASMRRFHQMGLGPVNVITRFVAAPEDITAPDANTVQFKLSFGTDIFIAAMASQYGPLVVSPAAMAANKTDADPYAHEWFRSNPIGTGPYKLKEYVQNDYITLERFQQFHRGWDGAHFDEIVFRIVTEAATRRQIVEAGQGDALTFSLTPEDVVAIEQAGKLAVLRYDSTNADWVAMNYVKFADLRVRTAFAWAFPYDEVRSGIYRNLIVASSGPTTTTTRGYPKNGFIYTTDMAKAKQLLDESGWDKSQKLEFWISSASASGKALAQLFQASLQTLGISMDIIQKEEGSLTEFMYGEAPAEQRPHFVYWGWWPDYNDAWNEIYPNFHTKSIVPNGSNALYYSNAQVDQLLDKSAGSLGAAEYDQTIADINKVLVEDDPAAIFLGSNQWYTVMQPNIKGFTPNPIYINTYNVYDMYREAPA